MKNITLIATLLLSLILGSVTAYGAVPYVSATSPLDTAVNVDVMVPISITFSEVVTWASIANDATNNYSIRIYEDATNKQFKAFTYAPQSDDTSFVLSMTSALKLNTKYRVVVGSSVRSSSTDNSMAADHIFTFTTSSALDSTPPLVQSFLPPSGSIDNPLDSIVVVYFDEPIDPSTATGANVYLLDKSYNSVSVTLSYDDSMNSLTLTPTSLLNLDGVYYLYITPGIKDSSGNTMAGYLFAWPGFNTLVTDTIPPTIIATTPINGATSISTDTVKITFSEPINPATINSFTVVVKGPNSTTTTLTGVLSYDQGSNSAFFVVPGGFAFASDFVVNISTGVRDLAGNALSTAYSFKFTTSKAASLVPMVNYSQIPPFIAGSGVPPNVLLITDNSGSMKDYADVGNYVTTKKYYGYFDSEKMYDYADTGSAAGWTANVNASNKSVVVTDVSTTSSGNFLNWLLTSRIDALRMVLVGGVKDNANQRIHYPDAGNGATKSYGGKTYTLSNSASKLVFKVGTKTYASNVNITNAERDASLGIIRDFKDKMNIGIMHFNVAGSKYEVKGDKADGGYIAINVGQTGADFVTDILTTDPATNTPLAESLLEAVQYFKGANGLYNNANYAAVGADPIKNACAKNFVVIVTDGEPTRDKNLPGGNWGKCATCTATQVTVADAGMSVKDYMDGNSSKNILGIKFLEGWASSRWATPLLYDGTTDLGGTWYLPAVAYYAHTTDLRSDYADMQNLSIYTVFAFDNSPNAKELLKLTAKYGGFDLGGTNEPDQQVKWDKNKVGTPDNYFEAADGGQMVVQLTKAFNDILSKVSSGTAASILNNSEGSGANLLQAVFYPKKAFENAEITWTGELQNLWYYLDPFLKNSTIRVDTVSDNKLNVKEDYIARFLFDTTSQKTVVNLYKDANGDGVPDTGTALGPYSPDDTDNVKSLWRAGRLLWERDVTAYPRTIYTYTGGLTDSSAKSFDDATTHLAKFSNVIEPGYASKLTADPIFQNMLQGANTTEADKLVKYIHGVPETDALGNMIDLPGYRSRLVKIGSTFGLWRLGDIVSSTPKLLANIPLNSYAQEAPTGYNDTTYEQYTKSADYQNRGMVFVGSNDGMLHAFKLGKLVELQTGSNKARLEGTELGKEEWSFIPRNVLPYLRYTADPAYSHLYLVDGSTTIFEASINAPSDNDNSKYPGCDSAHYWKCVKKTVVNSTTKALDLNKTSWRTILIGSTGLGGASRNLTGSGYCYESTTGTNCVKTPVDGVGYSSYYALDVTDPVNPKFLWDFNGDPSAGVDANKKGGNLGYATTGPVIVREGDKGKNGRWFAVFASGPTGYIDTSITQFTGRSDQPLRLFVVDIATGKLVKTIETGIDNAFGGSLSFGAIDTDKSKPTSAGFYKDDALYVGYTAKTDATTWYNGGVVRVLTQESEYPDPSENTGDAEPSTLNKPWTVNSLISGIGPVTSSVTKLQDRGNGKLWLYFGTGRYFYKTSAGVDDKSSRRAIYGVKDPCYNGLSNDMDNTCTTSGITSPTLDLRSQTTLQADDPTQKGWYIELGQAVAGTSDSERVITDPVASPNGVVFFTTFQPVQDVCKYGGSSYIWAVNYATGGVPPARAMQGKLLMQVSTGAFAEISMSDAFQAEGGRRLTNAVQGVPPKAQGLSILTNPKPVKKIMHIQER